MRVLDLAGSPAEMGAAHGKAFAAEIKRYTDERVALAASGLWSSGTLTSRQVLDEAEAMTCAHEAFDADLHAEMTAMAAAAGISMPEAIIVGGFTDFVDRLRVIAGAPQNPALTEDDCTAVIVGDEACAGAGFLAQTWDMHDSATDHVVMLRLAPHDGPAVRIFTTTGCLGQIGMNSEGVCVGVNNLSGLHGTRGVTWPTVVRAMLKTSTAAEALEVLLSVELAGAHNYLIFDRNGHGYNVEAMPQARPVTKLTGEPIAHTNHTLDAAATRHQAHRDRPLMDSSRARLARAGELLAGRPITLEHLIGLTRDTAAICQVPSAPYHIESSGAAIMQPATDSLWACWGPPTHNDYEFIPPEGSTRLHDPLFGCGDEAAVDELATAGRV